MFDLAKNLMGNDADKRPDAESNRPAFTFDLDDDYSYPGLYEEADAMNQASLLIYTITDLRSLAKKDDTKLKTPERVLSLPLKLGTCLEMIEENLELIQKEFGDDDHAMTMSALQSIQQRYDTHALSSTNARTHHWWNPFGQPSDGSVEIQEVAATLVAYGDDKPDSELVYAVVVDPIHKRVTVVFRGSITATDFLTDACITLNQQPNPVKNTGDDQNDIIGIHHGFFAYLFKPGKDGKNKYEEILRYVTTLFENPEVQKGYKLYVTGHSLGGALATLFSFHVAASALQPNTEHLIPTPITCVSVASPRVGEGSFQSAFRLLERRGFLRHLRIANEKDPVAIMPKSSGKMMWSMLSPISYIAFKIADNKFEEKETYRHTGIKLKLRKPGSQAPYEIEYSSSGKAKEEKLDSKMSAAPSFDTHKVPAVVFHMCKAYSDNLANVKDELQGKGMTLNELYKSHAVSNTTA